MAFESDERKRVSNLHDHGVDFRDAAQIFDGVTIEAEHLRGDDGEPRFRALERVDNDYFMVAYTWRGETRRIISAWRVDDEGRRRYEAILRRNA